LIALSLVYPLIIFNLFGYFMKYLAMDPMGPALANLENTREEFLWLLVVLQVILLSLTFLISIFMSHRIAGPLYKLRMFLHQAAAGKMDQKLAFRKNDYFQDLVPAYNELLETVHTKIARKSEGIDQAIPIIEKAILHSSTEVRAELEAALTSLKGTRDTE
jgi:nitrogen fixation/metabolism regulation signal transduction histidine kinase